MTEIDLSKLTITELKEYQKYTHEDLLNDFDYKNYELYNRRTGNKLTSDVITYKSKSLLTKRIIWEYHNGPLPINNRYLITTVRPFTRFSRDIRVMICTRPNYKKAFNNLYYDIEYINSFIKEHKND